jgi:hypothetical protein
MLHIEDDTLHHTKIVLNCSGPGWAPVAHTCNPSYSGGRDQENLGLKPAWANSLQNPISKLPNTKKGW